MKRSTLHTLCCLRMSILLLGCGSAGTGLSTAPSTGQTRYQQPAKMPSPQKQSISSGALKGTDSDTARESRQNTDTRMAKWNVEADKVRAVAPLVETAARDNELPASLIYSVIWVESRFNPKAKSPVGARGLMQLMPKTARYLADLMEWPGRADSYDPEFNIAAGSYYLRRLVDQFDGDLDLALAAYNAGPGNIRKWMTNTGLPPVSIEYYTMVRTAQHYFGVPTGPDTPHGNSPDTELPSDADLDKLGLAVLIAGLSDSEFGLQRTDSANPFN